MPREIVVNETQYLNRQGALIKVLAYRFGTAVDEVKYSFVYVNPAVCFIDNYRVLGYDNAHSRAHDVHFMGTRRDLEVFPGLDDGVEVEIFYFVAKASKWLADRNIGNVGLHLACNAISLDERLIAVLRQCESLTKNSPEYLEAKKELNRLLFGV